MGQVVTPGSTPRSYSLNGTPQVGRFYGPSVTAAPAGSALSAANRLIVVPYYLSGTATLKSLSFNITTGNASAWNGRMCVYADNGAGLPGALAVDSGTVAVGSGSVTGVQTATLGGGGTSLGGPAWYWVGMMADSAAESLSSITNANGIVLSSGKLLGWASAANVVGNANNASVYMAQTFGACPSAFSASPTFNDNSAPPYIILGY